MTRRHSFAQVLKELRGAQSSLTRADVKHRRRGSDWHDAIVTKARVAMAEAVRCVRALRSGVVKRGRAA